MKFWKHTLITAFAFLGITSTVLYTSCEQDPCLDLRCKNQGSCSEGFCRCQTGYEGTECETLVSEKFVGVYYGATKCNDVPPRADSVRVFVVKEPMDVAIVQYSRFNDTLYGKVNGMELDVIDRTANDVTTQFTIVLDRKKLNLYREEKSGSTNTVCNFIGDK